MTSFRNGVYALIVPMSIVMPVWVLAGRMAFGLPLGWMAVSLTAALPVLYVGVAVTTALALFQARLQDSRRPRLSTLQAWLHVLFWSSAGLLGATVLDCYSEDCDVHRDTEHLYSILTRLAGWVPGVVQISNWLMYFFAVISALLWLALAAALATGVFTAWRRRPPHRSPPPRARPWTPGVPGESRTTSRARHHAVGGALQRCWLRRSWWQGWPRSPSPRYRRRSSSATTGRARGHSGCRRR
ncbi:hypothetical protein [Mycolicibacterium palauense]|uniref:hypothetical protein n=1 Tax=Mycolicibacterium palauense TaxID=2034511 RepID=UPI00159BAAC6|nr:hypothetical protein [Mycolicibacterium palauense]